MYISKISGGGGRAYLGKEYHGVEHELRWPDDEITGGGAQQRTKKEEDERKEDERRAQPNTYVP
jgi:hypothetical protein